MSSKSALNTYTEGRAWWDTSISNINKNEIIIRGYPIQELIGNLSYSQMLYFVLCGDILTEKKAHLFESVLVAGADHGVRAPSIASARMAATCGVSFNSAVATGINVLGDVHGGASEGAMKLFYNIYEEIKENQDKKLVEIAGERLDKILINKERLPGFGHQLHDDDPRVKRLYVLSKSLIEEGEITGEYLRIAETFKSVLGKQIGKTITMNIDGVSAAIQCELGIPAEASKGVFALSRGIGIVAHAYEELKNDVLIKGPCPNREDLIQYSGPPIRHLEK